MTEGQKFFDTYCRVEPDRCRALLLFSVDGKYRTEVPSRFCNSIRECGDTQALFDLLSQQFEESTVLQFWPQIYKACKKPVRKSVKTNT